LHAIGNLSIQELKNNTDLLADVKRHIFTEFHKDFNNSTEVMAHVFVGLAFKRETPVEKTRLLFEEILLPILELMKIQKQYHTMLFMEMKFYETLVMQDESEETYRYLMQTIAPIMNQAGNDLAKDQKLVPLEKSTGSPVKIVFFFIPAQC